MNDYPALHPGLADFAVIRSHGGLYVDKTACFRDLLATVRMSGTPPWLANTHQILVRPRRFGKTLLLNTLETWFQGLPPERTAQFPPSDRATLDVPAGWASPAWLWDGLDGGTWHGHHGWRPVVRLNMARAAAADPAATTAALQDYLWEIARVWHRRGLDWDGGEPHTPTTTAAPDVLLTHLLQRLHTEYNALPVVLVDEYDSAVTEHIGTDADPTPAAAALRRFYRVLKDDEGLVYGVFVTGITRLARQHLFSAANNFVDISERETYAAICGFTDQEVEECLRPHRQALQELDPRLDDDHMLATWRDMYNGYRFTPTPSERVYNPYTLIHGLERTLTIQPEREAAVRGRWPLAWSETATPALAVRLAADTHQTLSADVSAGKIPSPAAHGLDSLLRPDFTRLMQDTGYYTWYGGEEGSPPHLNFPNREVAHSWLHDLLVLWNEHERPQAANLLNQIQERLCEGDMDGFAGELEVFFSGLAYQNLASEACFRAVLQTLFRLAGDHVQAEKSTWGGRSDLEATFGNHTYVVEVKLGRSAAEALRQIRDRPYGRELLQPHHTVTAVGLAFRKDDVRGTHLECEYADLSELLSERNTDTSRRSPGIF
ncbi:MAG: AAA family ATPase [Caldilineaceae bacterium]|nr:AAA family ATPase [Caldilineaceae bacterium]